MQGRVTLWAAIVAIGLALFGPATAATAQPGKGAHTSVVGGKAAPLDQFPWMAHLEYEVATGPWICSGTVVAPRVVLTAAHCAEDPESDSLAPAFTYKVITGLAEIPGAKAADISAVAEVVVLPQFKPSLVENDAALLILKQPVKAPAVPLASPPAGDLLAADTPVSMAGWGVTDPRHLEAAAALHAGNGEIVSRQACERTGGTPAEQLCVSGAPDFRTIACYGDSGGPAIARQADGTRVEVGIFSLVSSAICNPRGEAVYTRVDRISGWVERWIAAVEAGGPRPRAREQHPHLPYLTIFRAKQIAAKKLEEQLPIGLLGASERNFTCRRRSVGRVSCEASWIRERNYLYGSVIVYFRISGREVTWDDRFRIHSVSRACHAGPHPSRCPVHTLERPPLGL
jgi:trypsin